jgi:CRISPR-associated endonuclease/helicase Cas3
MTDKPEKPVDWDFDEDAEAPTKNQGEPTDVAAEAAPQVAPTPPEVEHELAAANEQESETSGVRWLRAALGLKPNEAPFAWQEELLSRFMRGSIERLLDIPTGLGKTSVMALWLVARAHGAALPRRLVYVVDRRAVVDQATDVAESLRTLVGRDTELRAALGLSESSLAISTLRGQHVDNREWLDDPASPAIVVGTVDMVGSRLLFEGYGVTRKMRPFHAGLLGADTLLVLDEAHLVPPFERLLESITDGIAVFGPQVEALRKVIPSFHLMSLSATGRSSRCKPFGLTADDLRPGSVSRKRLDATKRVVLHRLEEQATLERALAEHAWELSGQGSQPVRCIVFANQRKVVQAAKEELEKLVAGNKRAGHAEVAIDTELFVGGRRVREREEAAKRLRALGFIAGSSVARVNAAFVFATSAGEVGVDLDADHMVSDLVAWERMVQRLGRVNRRGEGDAKVVVLYETQTKKEAKAAPEGEAELREAVCALFNRLPALSDNARNASPGALRQLKQDEQDPSLRALVEAATTDAPLRPVLSRALLEAWSMTSLKQHPGRPEVAPWLRGWIESDPQTALVWRVHFPTREGGVRVGSNEIEGFFEAAPPHASELLETETYKVIDWLLARAKSTQEMLRTANAPPEGDSQTPSIRAMDVVAVALDAAGELLETFQLNRIGDFDKKYLHRILAGGTLIVDARLAGLATSGLLDERQNHHPATVDGDDTWIAAQNSSRQASAPLAPAVRFRIREADATPSVTLDADWRERLRFAKEVSDDGEVRRWLIVDKWHHDAATEDDRSAGRPQELAEHQDWAGQCASDLAKRLGLSELHGSMLTIAARLHDEGKRAKRWQRAFSAPDDRIYAKTLGPLNIALLDGYRHEFGSLPLAARDPELSKLPDELRELVLHLIAAHHGFARPLISTSGCEDAPPSALETRARDVALRFARLQKQWGPWGLAWWEALLRAADQQASRRNDAAAIPPKGGTRG